MNSFIVGLDLGQASDFTALAVAERHGDPSRYDFRHLQRFKLGTAYPEIVRTLLGIFTTPALRGATLIADATGVGAPVVDMLRAAGLSPWAATITGGDAATWEGSHVRVPKRDLVSEVQVLLQSGRLKIAKELPDAEVLVAELLNFQVRITSSANDVYGAWREGTHDDLVLAVALACWWGGHRPWYLDLPRTQAANAGPPPPG
jgi:hypothetical protein